jgi:hypothetical protein
MALFSLIIFLISKIMPIVNIVPIRIKIIDAIIFLFNKIIPNIIGTNVPKYIIV